MTSLCAVIEINYVNPNLDTKKCEQKTKWSKTTEKVYVRTWKPRRHYWTFTWIILAIVLTIKIFWCLKKVETKIADNKKVKTAISYIFHPLVPNYTLCNIIKLKLPTKYQLYQIILVRSIISKINLVSEKYSKEEQQNKKWHSWKLFAQLDFF